MTLRRHFELIRHRTHKEDGHRTLFFTTAGGSRKKPARFLKPENVPEFEGERAWFVCERDPAGVWRAIQRVTERGEPYEENADAAVRR